MASTLSTVGSGPALAPLAMPHIYIHPDPEDKEEAWLYFDANDPLLNPYHESEDTEDQDDSASFDMATYSPVHFPVYDSTRALVDVLVHGTLSRSSEDVQDAPAARHSSSHDSTDDVVEVVKVRRTSEDNAPPKRPSKGMLSRALRTIRNVANPSKSKVQEQPSPAPSRRPSMLRRRTRDFSSTSQDLVPSPSEFGDMQRPSSPSPSTFTTRTKTSTFRRLSMLSLNKLFGSSQTSLVQTDDKTDSTTSSSPTTPATGTFPPIPSLPTHSKPFSLDDPADVSGEMQLDSLHFDDLSFDAEKFR